MDSESKHDFSSYTPDELRDLYEKNPVAFNELAADAIRRACIGQTEKQTLKLRRMQWAIDAQLQKRKTPLQKLQEMERIFYDQVYGNDGLLLQLNSACVNLRHAFRGDGDGSRKGSLKLVKK